MKRLYLIITTVLIAALFLAARPFDSDSGYSKVKKYQDNKEYKAQSGGKLSVHLKIGGSITVKSWNKEAVSVEYKLDDCEMKELEFEINSDNKNVDIDVEFVDNDDDQDGCVDFTIMVPEKYNIDFSTMGGDIDFSGIDGEFDGSTMGGSILLTNLKGKASVTTMGGDITTKNCDLDGEVKTMGGEIKSVDTKGSLKKSTMGGNIMMEGKNISGTDKPVVLSTMGGEINISEAFAGADLNTMGGNIKIEIVKNFLKAKTMGGDIKVLNADAKIDANTMGGNIEVKQNCSPDADNRDIDLTSMGGDITVYVPSGFDMEIEAEIKFDKRHEDKVKIDSDFGLTLETTKEWKSNGDHGKNKWKKLTGTFKQGNGKNKVTIKTTCGDIIIKKI